MKILITGASGYIGKHVVREFLQNNHEVYACDLSLKNFIEDFKSYKDSLKCIEKDIFSSNKFDFNDYGSPDILVHLAWQNGFFHNSESHIESIYKHFCFIRNMVDSGIKYITIMGSMHEIGYWEGKIDENTPCRPQSFYGIAKNALREIVSVYVENKPVNFHWLRAFYITGDDFHNNSIFTKLLKSSIDGCNKFPFTSGKNKYDFIDIRELAKMIYASSVQDKVNGVINVCSGKPVSLIEKVRSFILEHNLDIELEVGAYPERKYDSPIVYGCTKKIEKIICNSKNNLCAEGKKCESIKNSIVE